MKRDADISVLLAAARTGDARCESQLFDAVYAELRRLARAQMRSERPDHTLQASALVHEAYIRMLGHFDVGWENRAHFFKTAAGTMRRILIDHARARNARKRDGALQRVALDEPLAWTTDEDASRLVMLNDALEKLAGWDPRQATVVELRFFAGLSVEETAEVLGVSPKTVKRDWSLARAWLQTQIEGASGVR